MLEIRTLTNVYNSGLKQQKPNYVEAHGHNKMDSIYSHAMNRGLTSWGKKFDKNQGQHSIIRIHSVSLHPSSSVDPHQNAEKQHPEPAQRRNFL